MLKKSEISVAAPGANLEVTSTMHKRKSSPGLAQAMAPLKKMTAPFESPAPKKQDDSIDEVIFPQPSAAITNTNDQLLTSTAAEEPSSAENNAADSGMNADKMAFLAKSPEVGCKLGIQVEAVGVAKSTALLKCVKSPMRQVLHSQQVAKVGVNGRTQSFGARMEKSSIRDAGSLQTLTKTVDVLAIGGGPSTLGFVINAIKTNRFGELTQDDGLAIIDAGVSFGSGQLGNYGINSNTSANGFLKCTIRKHKCGPLGNPSNKLTAEKDSCRDKFLTAKGTQRSRLDITNVSSTAAATASKTNNCLSKNSMTVSPAARTIIKPSLVNLSSQIPTIVPAPILSDQSGQATGKTDDLCSEVDLIQCQKQLVFTIENQVSSQKSDPLLTCSANQNTDEFVDLDAAVESLHEQALMVQSAEYLLARPGAVDGSGEHTNRFKTQKTNSTEIQQEKKNQVRKKEKKSETSPLSTSNTATAEKSKRTARGSTKERQSVMRQKIAKTYGQVQPVLPQTQTAPSTLPVQDISKQIRVPEPELVLTPFKELVNSNLVNMMRKFNKNVLPLSIVGHLLNYVGNHLLSYAFQTQRKKIFYPRHKALSVQLMANGDIMTKVMKTDFQVTYDAETQNFTMHEKQSQLIYFRSKCLVLAAGASQSLHPQLFNWFPSLDPRKVLDSDSFLKKQLYKETIQKLKALQQERNEQFASEQKQEQSPEKSPEKEPRSQSPTKSDKPSAKKQKKKKKRSLNVVIIGGSHSGFSCAWMLLNGPANYNKNSANIQVKKVPYATRKTNKACTDCCHCQISLRKNHPQARGEDRDISSSRVSTTFGYSKTLKQTKSAKADDLQPSEAVQCPCVCKCFGFFRYDDWKVDHETDLPDFENNAGKIKILYRDKLRVFFKNQREAEEMNYHEYDKQRITKGRDGYIYSFTGLRGDAKRLYADVKSGKENRVQFVKAVTPADQAKHVEKADLVIWACGYQSSYLPILDHNKKELELSQRVQGTQFDVDGKCRVMLSDGNVLNKVFACGVGFPVRTKDGQIGQKDQIDNPRADGFSLYMNAVGDQLLKNILPKKKLTQNTQHKELSSQWLNNATYEQITKTPGQSRAKSKKLEDLTALGGLDRISTANAQTRGKSKAAGKTTQLVQDELSTKQTREVIYDPVLLTSSVAPVNLDAKGCANTMPKQSVANSAKRERTSSQQRQQRRKQSHLVIVQQQRHGSMTGKQLESKFTLTKKPGDISATPSSSEPICLALSQQQTSPESQPRIQRAATTEAGPDDERVAVWKNDDLKMVLDLNKLEIKENNLGKPKESVVSQLTHPADPQMEIQATKSARKHFQQQRQLRDAADTARVRGAGSKVDSRISTHTSQFRKSDVNVNMLTESQPQIFPPQLILSQREADRSAKRSRQQQSNTQAPTTLKQAVKMNYNNRASKSKAMKDLQSTKILINSPYIQSNPNFANHEAKNSSISSKLIAHQDNNLGFNQQSKEQFVKASKTGQGKKNSKLSKYTTSKAVVSVEGSGVKETRALIFTSQDRHQNNLTTVQKPIKDSESMPYLNFSTVQSMNGSSTTGKRKESSKTTSQQSAAPKSTTEFPPIFSKSGQFHMSNQKSPFFEQNAKHRQSQDISTLQHRQSPSLSSVEEGIGERPKGIVLRPGHRPAPFLTSEPILQSPPIVAGHGDATPPLCEFDMVVIPQTVKHSDTQALHKKSPRSSDDDLQRDCDFQVEDQEVPGSYQLNHEQDDEIYEDDFENHETVQAEVVRELIPNFTLAGTESNELSSSSMQSPETVICINTNESIPDLSRSVQDIQSSISVHKKKDSKSAEKKPAKKAHQENGNRSVVNSKQAKTATLTGPLEQAINEVIVNKNEIQHCQSLKYLPVTLTPSLQNPISTLQTVKVAHAELMCKPQQTMTIVKTPDHRRKMKSTNNQMGLHSAMDSCGNGIPIENQRVVPKMSISTTTREAGKVQPSKVLQSRLIVTQSSLASAEPPAINDKSADHSVVYSGTLDEALEDVIGDRSSKAFSPVLRTRSRANSKVRQSTQKQSTQTRNGLGTPAESIKDFKSPIKSSQPKRTTDKFSSQAKPHLNPKTPKKPAKLHNFYRNQQPVLLGSNQAQSQQVQSSTKGVPYATSNTLNQIANDLKAVTRNSTKIHHATVQPSSSKNNVAAENTPVQLKSNLLHHTASKHSKLIQKKQEKDVELVESGFLAVKYLNPIRGTANQHQFTYGHTRGNSPQKKRDAPFKKVTSVNTLIQKGLGGAAADAYVETASSNGDAGGRRRRRRKDRSASKDSSIVSSSLLSKQL